MPWLTGGIPDANDFICRRVRIPNERTLRASVTGALLDLALCENWEKFGDLEPADAEQLFIAMLQDFLEDDMCGIGKIEMYGRDTLPANVLPCDGSVYSKEDYPLLYEVIHFSLKIAGNLFKTPDLRDRFIIGQGPTNTVNDTGGQTEVTLNLQEMPIHTHTTQAHAHTSNPHSHIYTSPTFGIDIEGVGVPDPTGVGNPPIPKTTATSTVTINQETVIVDNEGEGLPHDNMPPYYVAMMGIVAR